jgi:hypothetical protein
VVRCVFAPAVAFPIGTVKVWSVAGWQADEREGRGGGRVAWLHSEEAKKKKLGVGAKLQRNTV